MKLTIERDGVKRVIRAPFRLCLSKADAAELARQLTENAPPVYGWMTIYPGEWRVESAAPGTEPLDWVE